MNRNASTQDLLGNVSCAQARETAQRVLAGLGSLPERLREDVLTVVTELIANARRHGGGVTGFRLTTRPGRVSVEVSDRSAQFPRKQPWDPATPGGFGWLLVNSLAESTDVLPHHEGKTVVATLATGQAGYGAAAR